MEELYFGYNYKNINNSFNSSKLYYIKDIYGKGIDINFFFDFNGATYVENNLQIHGLIISYDYIKYIDSFESLEEIIVDCDGKNKCKYISGKADNLTKSGLISFDMEFENESNKEDKYYLFVFDIPENFIDFSVEIFVDSKYNSQFILQKNKYFRGSFNLLNYINNINNQSKTYFVQFEENEGKNNSTNNNTYIIEFSSSRKNIIIVFNNEFNCDKKIIGGVQKYYISTGNLKQEQFNFTIQFNRTNQNDLEENDNFYHGGIFESNYIIKFYKKEKDYNLDFILDKDIKFIKLDGPLEDKYYYNITIKNNRTNIKNLNNYFKYNYLIQIFLKSNINNIQILNTTAFIERFDILSHQHITYDPNEEFSFSSKDIHENKNYFVYLFVKVSDKNNENYLSKIFEINTKLDNTNNNNKKSNRKNLVKLIIIFGGIFVITLIIFLIVCVRYRKKNKNLKQKIEEISSKASRRNSEESLGIVII